MAENTVTTNEVKGNAYPHATANYVALSGEHINSPGALTDALYDVAWTMEEAARGTRGKGKEALLEAVKAVSELAPDLEAMPPEPDPIAKAQLLLMLESQRAQELLRTESARQRKEAMAKEAFCIPCGLLNDIILALRPELRRRSLEDEQQAVEAILERHGWETKIADNPAFITARYKPLRLMSDLIKRFPSHPLTGQVLEVLHHVLRWCENTSHCFTSPISGYANGTAPEGVLYPRISMKLVPLKSSGDVPNEWRKPLTDDLAGREVGA